MKNKRQILIKWLKEYDNPDVNIDMEMKWDKDELFRFMDYLDKIFAKEVSGE